MAKSEPSSEQRSGDISRHRLLFAGVFFSVVGACFPAGGRRVPLIAFVGARARATIGTPPPSRARSGAGGGRPQPHDVPGRVLLPPRPQRRRQGRGGQRAWRSSFRAFAAVVIAMHVLGASGAARYRTSMMGARWSLRLAPLVCAASSHPALLVHALPLSEIDTLRGDVWADLACMLFTEARHGTSSWDPTFCVENASSTCLGVAAPCCLLACLERRPTTSLERPSSGRYPAHQTWGRPSTTLVDILEISI